MVGTQVTKTNTTIGRPTKLTPKLIDQICQVVANGNYIQTACQIVNISKPTYYDWLKRGGEDQQTGIETVYSSFLNAIKKAEADSEAKMVEVIRQVATEKKEWLPAMTYLERRHPDRWGRKDRSKVDITERKAVTITHVEVVLDKGDGTTVVEGESREIKNATKQG